MRESAQKNRRTTQAGQLGGTGGPAQPTRSTTQTGMARPTQRGMAQPTQPGMARTTPADPLRRTTPGFLTTGVTQIRPARSPGAAQSRAMVPVRPRHAPPEPTRFGQLLDDITLLIAILGVVGALACTMAAVLGWI